MPFKNYILPVAITEGYLAVVKCTLRGASTAVVARALSVIGDRENYHYRSPLLQGSSVEVNGGGYEVGGDLLCGCLPSANKNKEAVEKRT